MVEACADPWVHALMVVRVPALRRGRFAVTRALRWRLWRFDCGASLRVDLVTVPVRLGQWDAS